MAENERGFNIGEVESSDIESRLRLIPDVTKLVKETFPKYEEVFPEPGMAAQQYLESGAVYFQKTKGDGDISAKGLKINYDGKSFGISRGRVKLLENGLVDPSYFHRRIFYYHPPFEKQPDDQIHSEWHYGGEGEPDFLTALKEALADVHEVMKRTRRS